VKDFFFVEQWPVGPPWFIWVLFVFNILFALIYSLRRKWESKTLLFNVDWGKKPVAFIFCWFLFTFFCMYHLHSGWERVTGPALGRLTFS
jgi:glucan biosynthesis protein C